MKKSKISTVLAIMAIALMILSNVAYSLPMMSYTPQNAALATYNNVQLAQSSYKQLNTAVSTDSGRTSVVSTLNIPEYTLVPQVQDNQDSPESNSQIAPAPDTVMPEYNIPPERLVPQDQDDQNSPESNPQTAPAPEYSAPKITIPKDLLAPQDADSDGNSGSDNPDSNSGLVVNVYNGPRAQYNNNLPQQLNPDVLAPEDDEPELERLTPQVPDWMKDLPRIVLAPDFRISGLTMTTNGKLHYGESVVFKYVVKNEGVGSGVFKVLFYEDTKLSKVSDAETKLIRLAVGESYTGTLKYVYEQDRVVLFGRPTMVRPRFVVSNLGSVQESDTSDNSVSTSLWLYPAKPDAQPQLTYDLQAVLSAEDRVHEPMEDVQFHVVVKNKGNQDVSGVVISLDFGDATAKYSDTISVQAGKTYTKLVTHQYKPGTWHPTLSVDTLNKYIELDEKNNYDTETIEVNDIVVQPETQCSDGLDNDRDGLVDSADPGCSDGSDDDESDDPVTVTQCSDGLDNDGDGLTDMDDPDCTSPEDQLEVPPVHTTECSDGLDNDGDGLTDHDDLGCDDESDNDESDDASSVNEEPVAVLTVTPGYGTSPLSITLDGSQSYDPDTAIIKYYWTLSGPDYPNGAELVFGDGQPGTLNLTLVEDGLYTFHLSVTDDGVVYQHDEVEVVAEQAPEVNEAPVIDLDVSPLSGAAPLEVTADGTGSYDPDGQIEEFTWVFTGPMYNGTYVVQGQGTPDVQDLVFTETGTYTIRLYVRDNGGDLVSDRVDVNVTSQTEVLPNEAPVALCEVSPVTGVEPLDINVDCSGSYDPDGSIEGFSLDFVNLNTTTVHSRTGTVPGSYNFTLEAGTWELSLDVTDDDSETSTYTTTFEVYVTEVPEDPENPGNETNQPPVPMITLDPWGGEAPLNVTISGQDSYDADGVIVEHSWIVQGPQGYNMMWLAESGTPNDHMLPLTIAGNYSVELVVMDDDNVADTTTVTFELTGDTVDDGNGNGGNTTDSDNDGVDDSEDVCAGHDDNVDSDNDGIPDGCDSTPNGDNSSDEKPDISHIEVRNVKTDSASIKWETDIESTSKVCFGEHEDHMDDCETDNDDVVDHEIELEDLDENTKYYYSVKSCNGSKCDEEGPFHFTTLKEDDDDDDEEDEEEYDSWEFDSESFLAAVAESNRARAAANTDSGSSGTAPVQESPQAVMPAVEVVFASTQYITVEEPVCKLRFLWWCVWKDWVKKKIPVPAVVQNSGIQFEI